MGYAKIVCFLWHLISITALQVAVVAYVLYTMLQVISMALFCFPLPKNSRFVLLGRKMQSNNKNDRQIFRQIFSFSNLLAIIINHFI